MLKSDCGEAAVSYSFFPSPSLSYFTCASLLLTPLSFLCPSAPHTHAYLLCSLSIRSVITGQCQRLKTVVLAELVSSQVELAIFPAPDCKKPTHSNTPIHSIKSH